MKNLETSVRGNKLIIASEKIYKSAAVLVPVNVHCIGILSSYVHHRTTIQKFVLTKNLWIMGQTESSLHRSYADLTRAYQSLQFSYDAIEDELFTVYQDLDNAQLKLARKQHQAKRLRVSNSLCDLQVETI